MTKQIPLNGKHGVGKFALIDDADYELVSRYTWFCNDTGYAATNERDPATRRYKTLLMHHLFVKISPGLVTDHINRNRLDNRRTNLRLVDRTVNAINASLQKNKKSSRYVGVDFSERQKEWHARIGYKNQVIHLGWFKTELEAAIARDEGAKKYHGEYAVLNFP